MLYFGGCDYFRLSSHPDVLAAAATALTQGGMNVAASRATTGNHPLHGQLELVLRRFFRSDTALLASSGYAAALLVAHGLEGEVSHVFLDEKSHGCLRDAAHWLRKPTRTYRHRDPNDLRRQLARLPSSANPLIATDGMFAADGSVAPLDELLTRLPANSLLWIDDSHGAGTLGNGGQGTLEELNTPVRNHRRRIIRTLTLSKAFGCYGGAVLASTALRDRIVQNSRLFTGNTPLPPMFAAATLASIELVKSDGSLRRRLRANTARLRSLLAAEGWPVEESPSPVLALVPESLRETARMRKRLLKAGILPTVIRYPGGPEGGFLRLAVSSEHSEEQVELLGRSLRRD